MTDIQDHINLFLNAVIPNMMAYRMRPKQHEDLQWEVENFYYRLK